MFLYIGNNKSVRKKSVIGIFDADSATVSPTTKKFLSDCEKRGQLESAGACLPKSFILYSAGKSHRVCFSGYATPTFLEKRAGKSDGVEL